MTQPAFGRRGASLTARAPVRAQAVPHIATEGASKPLVTQPRPTVQPPPPQKVEPSLEEELREWARIRQGFKVPWRQLTFMASLCFGSASFLLPDSVNGAVQWILFGLTAASLIATFTRRRAERRA